MTQGYIRTAFFAVFLLSTAAAPCLADSPGDIPHIIQNKDGQFSLHLPDSMDAALESFDPDFSVRQMSDYPGWLTDLYEHDRSYAPFALIADFNCDGTLDAALEGQNGKFERTIVLLSKNETFEAVTVRDGSPKHFSTMAQSALFKAPPGTYISPIDDEVLTLEKDGFGIMLIEKGLSDVLYYEKGRFKSFLTGD